MEAEQNKAKEQQDAPGKGSVDVIGRELIVPFSLSFQALLPLLVLLFGNLSSWEARLGALLISIAFGLMVFLSLYPLSKIWEYRQQRWMEEQAKSERDTLRKHSKDEADIRVELEANYRLEQQKNTIELLKQLKELKPEKDNKDKDYQSLFDKVKEQLTQLIENQLKQIENPK